MAKDRHERVCGCSPEFRLTPQTAGGHYIKYQCDLCALINVYTYDPVRAWDLVLDHKRPQATRKDGWEVGNGQIGFLPDVPLQVRSGSKFRNPRFT